MSKAIVVLSGGMDSTTLLHYVKRVLKYDEVYAITFMYGQKHVAEVAMAEFQVIEAEVIEHQITDITFMKELLKGSSALIDENIEVPHIKEVVGSAQPITYVPNRNMLLLAIAVSWAEAKGCDKVFYGAQAHDQYSGYWDASKEFVVSINNTLNLNRKNKITIEAPFIDMKKDELLLMGLDLNINYVMTMTCYNGKIPACGTCPTCADRIMAFRKIKRIDPLEYATKIPWSTWGCK